MAFDEILLKNVTRPLLRLYRWKERCVTFGYFQKISDVKNIFPDKQLVRRWTGGGAVDHRDDLTFSLIVPHDSPVAKERPLLFYEKLHRAMASALADHQIKTDLATLEDTEKGGACFVAPALHDLLIDGQKILGGAQRRSAGKLLYQGSLFVKNWKAEDCFERGKSLFQTLVSKLSTTVIEIEEQPKWLEEAALLARERYLTKSWLTKNMN